MLGFFLKKGPHLVASHQEWNTTQEESFSTTVNYYLKNTVPSKLAYNSVQKFLENGYSSA